MASRQSYHMQNHRPQLLCLLIVIPFFLVLLVTQFSFELYKLAGNKFPLNFLILNLPP
jgi:hypothetical protein